MFRSRVHLKPKVGILDVNSRARPTIKDPISGEVGAEVMSTEAETGRKSLRVVNCKLLKLLGKSIHVRRNHVLLELTTEFTLYLKNFQVKDSPHANLVV